MTKMIYKNRLIIYAPNIHSGGGLILLKSLIKNYPKGVNIIGYFDSRASNDLDLEKSFCVNWVDPKIISRFQAERSLLKSVSKGDIVLAMNSLPPLFKSKGKIIVFLQNRNLIEPIALFDFKFKIALRLFIERAIAFFLRSRVDEYIIQTNSFKRDLQNWYNSKKINHNPVFTVLPFIEFDPIINTSLLDQSKKQFNFIYPADNLPHKNHLALFNAWEILADQKIFPSLAVTLPKSEQRLLKKLEVLQKKGCQITNLGFISHDNLLQKFILSKALIFPSLRESFGLPLLEASQLNIPILASELEYVYDVCEPSETFDPTSPRSISRAVRRFLNISPSLRKVQDPADFINYIIDSAIYGDDFATD